MRSAATGSIRLPYNTSSNPLLPYILGNVFLKCGKFPISCHFLSSGVPQSLKISKMQPISESGQNKGLPRNNSAMIHPIDQTSTPMP